MRLALIFICAAIGTISISCEQESRGQTLSPRFVPPRVVAVTEAVYPIFSVASGTVVLEVTIDNTGAVAGVSVVRGIASLTEEAERAVRKWKFEPARFEGRPVSSEIPVAFSFVPPGFGPRV